jgi:hypothetical protein
MVGRDSKEMTECNPDILLGLGELVIDFFGELVVVELEQASPYTNLMLRPYAGLISWCIL